MMRAVAALSLATLAACAGPDIWVKPGASASDAEAQKFACRMQAKAANPHDGLSGAIDARVCMQVHGFADISTPAGRAAAGMR